MRNTAGVLVTEPEAACREAQSGKTAILLPSALVFRDDELPHSWDVTSDSIAAWVAAKTGCGKLVLLKDVDGLMPSGTSSGGCIDSMTVEQLRHHDGGVDPYLHRILARKPLETWILNGLKPERLAELLRSGTASGTLILPHSG